MPFEKGHKSGMTGRHHSLETITKMSLSAKGRPVTPQQKLKMRFAKLGKKASLKTRKKMSELRKLQKEKNPFWKGGISSVNSKVRESFEYKLWRESVFERDKYTCVWCGAKSGIGEKVYLNADHIKPFAHYPELRFAIDNGRTLCVPCHKTTDTYLIKSRWIK